MLRSSSEFLWLGRHGADVMEMSNAGIAKRLLADQDFGIGKPGGLKNH
jgi:hypothetical protein